MMKYKKILINMKTEVEKYLEHIEELEDKIVVMEENNFSKQNIDDNLDEIILEYNKYKERMESKINEHIKKEEELRNELDNKEETIEKMKNDIENLELDNIQLKNQTEQKEKAYDAELVNIDKILYENEKLKSSNIILQDKLKYSEQQTQMLIKYHKFYLMNQNPNLI